MKYDQLREYYEANQDKYTIRKKTDTRKARLTLRHLNKLRKKRELAKLENEQRAQTLNAMYGSNNDVK